MAGEFISNPLVGAVGNAIGLQPLLSAAGADPSTQTPPPPVPPMKVVKAAPQTPREFRQHAPEPKSTQSTGRGLSPSGMNMPGMMSPDILMHPVVQHLLGQFGITPQQLTQTAQNASPDLFITNPAAHQNHPLLSGLIERGLEGAAFTQGSHTWGEGISNVAKGMLDANAARAEKYNAQLMMPFQQASAISGLTNEAQRQAFEEAQTRRANSQADLYDQTPEMRRDIAQIGADQRQSAIDSRVGMQRVANHLKVQMMPEFAQLNPEHSQAFQQEIAENGGDLGKLSDTRMEYYRQLGHADGLEAATRSKIRVRATPTTSNGTGANRRPDYTGDKADLDDAKGEESEAEKQLDAFNARMGDMTKAPTRDPVTGQMYIPGSTAAAARQKELQDNLNKARQKRQRIVQNIKTKADGGKSSTRSAPEYVWQGGVRYKVTSKDKNGKVTAAEPAP